MNGFFSGKGFKVMVTIVVFFLVVALVSSGNSYVNNFMTSFILTPIQQVASGGAYTTGDVLTPPKSNEQLQKEVSELEEENRRLNDMLVEYYDIKRQNEELTKFYDIKKENTDFSVVPATVIGRDPNENFYGFTADKGSADGIRLNDPVMTENGLVGWVCEVAPRSCKVTTILSPDASIGASDKKTTEGGIISGSPEISDDGITRLINISAQNKMEKDDIIVTSGYGGIFPKNLKIGKIKELSHDSYTGLPVAVIEPFENVKDVSSVAIVVNFSGKGDIEETSREKQESSRN